MLNFYYPLRLGRRAWLSSSGDDDGLSRRARGYESWREGIHRSLVEYDEYPEDRVLEWLLTATGMNRFSVILGEPGSGKTTLFKAWFRRLATRTTEPALGMVVPVLVRLRSVPAKIWRINDINDLADALWNNALKEAALLENRFSGFYEAKRCRAFQPAWLLDGLDELPPQIGREEFVFQKLAILPGHKVVSARTAVYESLRHTADSYKATENEYEILGLTPSQQREFLQQALPGEGDKAENLFQDIQRNIQVSLLAANALMLKLMAEVTTAVGPAFRLPASRAAFYQVAIDKMWYEKLKADTIALGLREERDRYLTKAARAMGLVTLRGTLSSKMPKTLERGLRSSGLIRIDDLTRTFEFMHLTFQEYYLARALVTANPRISLEKHWGDSRYEETLALMISLLAQQNRYRDIMEGIQWLVGSGLRKHDRNPQILWKLGASPLRVACRVLARSAMLLPEGQLASFLLNNIIKSGNLLCNVAISRERFVPPMLLLHLAREKDIPVREGVAENANVPPNLLVDLADDESAHVRAAVARHVNTPAAVLADLAQDQHEDVRGAVAYNPNSPVAILADLSRDPGHWVREAVAWNTNVTPEILAELAWDRYPFVAAEAIKNKKLPRNVLSQLARSGSEPIRWTVAETVNTPYNVLIELAHDESAHVRNRVASNENTPANILAELARDPDDYVRSGVAANVNTSSDILTDLAHDSSSSVRQGVAVHKNTPFSIWSRLAHDPDEYVRATFAECQDIPEEILAELARDPESSVRLSLATYSRIPINLLVEFVQDPDLNVRAAVAGNRYAPPNLLAALVKDQTVEVRAALAGNRNAPPNVLARLGRCSATRVRQEVAKNPSTSPDVLATLARDQDESVCLTVAKNPNTLLEDLRETERSTSTRHAT
ncbi:MAG TPA: NACHT domain-containing protein [Candidatus Angelobacter sp.]|nr:NACHT domain-containing protein [Candidatus Angelobacter sp.]